MVFAVIETGGKQYKVIEGELIRVERLSSEAKEQVQFDKVLLVSQEGEVRVGTPYLDSVKILGTKVQDIRGPKVIAYKYKRRKNYKRKIGHRQELTLVRIDHIRV